MPSSRLVCAPSVRTATASTEVFVDFGKTAKSVNEQGETCALCGLPCCEVFVIDCNYIFGGLINAKSTKIFAESFPGCNRLSEVEMNDVG